jgi:hypothetical protein
VISLVLIWDGKTMLLLLNYFYSYLSRGRRGERGEKGRERDGKSSEGIKKTVDEEE